MKKKILISTLVFILFCIINYCVFASNFNISIETDSQNKDSITFLLKILDVNFDNNISTIEGNIEYDRDLFEEIVLESLNEWSIIYNNQENANGKFIGFKLSSEEIKQEDLCKMTLKLKPNIENANTQISIKNIRSADGDNIVSSEDKTIDIDIKNSAIVNTKEEKNPVSNKNLIKYILIIIIILLLITIATSISYLIQKSKYNKQYNEIIKGKNKKSGQ